MAKSKQSLAVTPEMDPKSSASGPAGALIPATMRVALVSFVIQKVTRCDDEPTATLPKLIDFGVAYTEPRLPLAAAVAGTPSTTAIRTGASRSRRSREPMSILHRAHGWNPVRAPR